jgi:hypothetical protein
MPAAHSGRLAFFLRQKELAIGYLTMLKGLDGGNPDYEVLRRGFVFEPISVEVVPTIQC